MVKIKSYLKYIKTIIIKKIFLKHIKESFSFKGYKNREIVIFIT